MKIGLQTSSGRFIGLSLGDKIASAKTQQMSVETWEEALGVESPEKQSQFSAGKAMRVSAWVYACVNAIISAIQSVPLKVERLQADGTYIFDDKAPPTQLLSRINPVDTLMDFIAHLTGSLELYGDTYFEIESNQSGEPLNLWPMHTMNTKVIPHPKNRIGGYIYQVNGKEIKLSPDEVLHIKYYHPTDIYNGLAPFKASLRGLTVDYYAQLLNMKLFKNGGFISGIFETEQSIGKEKAKELRTRLRKVLGGAENAGGFAIASEGLKYKPITPALRDMLFKELREFSREEIGSAFRVPPAILGILRYANYANYEAQKIAFWEGCIRPKLRWIETALNAYLMPRYGMRETKLGRQILLYRVAFDISTVKYLQENPNERAQRQALQIAGRIKSPNEIRAENGDEPMEGGETLIAGAVTIGEGEDRAVYDFTSNRTASQASIATMPIFDPVRQQGFIRKPALSLYRDLASEMHSFLNIDNRMARLRVLMNSINDAPERTQRRTLIEATNALFYPFDWHELQAARIREDFGEPFTAIYSRAARFAARKIRYALGQASAKQAAATFELVNPEVLTAIDHRATFWIGRGLGHAYDDLQTAFVAEYFDKWQDYSDEALLESVQRRMNYTATWEAERLARTETHIIGQMAQRDMFTKSRVEAHGWRHSGIQPGRDNHRALDGVEKNISQGERFQVGSYKAVGPGDPTMGVEELANCGCDTYPVIIAAEGIHIWNGN